MSPKATTQSASEVIDRTAFEPLVNHSPSRMYAAGALAALGAGFGIAAAATFVAAGLRSPIARANAMLAAGCTIAALGVRFTAQPEDPPAAAHPIEIRDENDAPPIDYSIIIPVYNRPEEIATLLRVLSDIGNESAHLGVGEIVVIDDGSTDGTADAVRRLAPQMSIPTRVVSKPNAGVSSGRNKGFAVARGAVGIVIDSDCIPEAGWLASMLNAVRSDPSLLVFARIRSGKRPVYPLENLPDRKGFVGASFAMDRYAYLALGGCDERYGASHDDRDLVLTALSHGHDVAHAANGWIAHPLRRETIRSMWRVGLNSRFGNLFAARHGAYAAHGTRLTPYYFFGIGSNYGSSIGFVVTAVNLLLSGGLCLFDPVSRHTTARRSATVFTGLAAAYVASLAALGAVTRARPMELPAYVATLSTFQIATLVGRIRGTLEYGAFLL